MLRSIVYLGTAALVASLLLTGCDSKMEPKVNPHPKYFLTVTGYIDPALHKDLKVRWGEQYYTHNPKCEDDGVWAAGSVERGKNIVFKRIIPDKDGQYRIKIPIDYYSPDFCKWKVTDIYYNYTYKKQDHDIDPNTAIGFATNSKVSDFQMHQSWLCNNSHCISADKNMLNPPRVSPQQSLHATINFEFRRNLA